METIIFRPTNNCNLTCTYCYDKENHSDCRNLRKDATELFQKNEGMIIEGIYKLWEKEKRRKLIFHGGEPLLVDSEVLDHFCNQLRDLNIRYSIQTNGTLIDQGTIQFFKNHNIHVGVSLDGCNEQQNSARVFPNGKNSFQTVSKKLKLLREHSISHGVIMSISKQQLGHEQEIYDFIAEQGFHCNIRPVYNANGDFAPNILTQEEYADFLKTLFDIWYDDKEQKVGTRQISELYEALREELDEDYHPRLCNSLPDCFRHFISLDVNGELHSCNRLYGIDKFHYGNIEDLSITDINSCIDQLERERKQTIHNKCGNCERLDICHGGCVAESFDMNHSLQEVACDKQSKVLLKKYVMEKIAND